MEEKIPTPTPNAQGITKLDPGDPLFDQIMALEKKQEEATKEAAAILSKAYGAEADVVDYSNRNNILVITFRIQKKATIGMPPSEVHRVPDVGPKPKPKVVHAITAGNELPHPEGECGQCDELRRLQAEEKGKEQTV